MQKEKNNFIFGIAVGVAVVSLLGFIIMSVAYFKKEGSKITSDSNTKELAQVKQPTVTPPTPTPAPTPTPTVDMNVKSSDHIFVVAWV